MKFLLEDIIEQYGWLVGLHLEMLGYLVKDWFCEKDLLILLHLLACLLFFFLTQVSKAYLLYDFN